MPQELADALRVVVADLNRERRLGKGGGHTSAFKLPTERKKVPEAQKVQHVSKKRGGKKDKGKSGNDAVMHV